LILRRFSFSFFFSFLFPSLHILSSFSSFLCFFSFFCLLISSLMLPLLQLFSFSSIFLFVYDSIKSLCGLSIMCIKRPVLLSEPPYNPREVREKTCELFFEKYQVPGFYMVKDAVLSALEKISSYECF